MILSVTCSGPNILSALQVPIVQNYTKKYTQRIKSPDSEKTLSLSLDSIPHQFYDLGQVIEPLSARVSPQNETNNA